MGIYSKSFCIKRRQVKHLNRRSDFFLVTLFLLSLLLLPAANFWSRSQKQLDDRRFVEEAEDQARALVQQFNANSTLSKHLRRGVIKAQNKLRQNSDPFADNGVTIKNALFNSLPSELIGLDASVYLFKLSQNRCNALIGKGIERQNSVFLARIVKQLKNWQQTPAAERTRINNRLANIFGTRVSGELLLDNRNGRMIDVIFNEQRRVLFWDFLKISDEVEGAFLILFSARPSVEAAASLSLHEIFETSSARFFPVLMPIESLQKNIRPVVPGRWRGELPVLRLFSEFSKKSGYDEVASFSAGTLHENTFVFRAAIAKHLPFELWLTTNQHGENHEFPTLLIFAILTIFWFAVYSLRLYRQRPFIFSVKTRMFGLIILVGGLPILLLFMAGLSVIKQDHHNRYRAMINDLRTELKEIDGNSTSLRMIFELTARKYLDDSEFKKAITAKVSDENSEIFRRCFADFTAAGVPLEAIGIMNFGRDDQMLFAPEIKTGRSLSKLYFFSPMMYAGLKDFSEKAYREAMGNLSESQRLGFESYQAITSSSLFKDISLARQKSLLMSFGSSGHFIIFDFIADQNKVVAAVIFFSPVKKAYSGFARTAIMRGARFSPERLWAMAEKHDGEIVLTVPLSQPRNNEQQWFFKNLLEARKTSSLKIAVQKETLQVCVPCENMSDIALASNVSLGQLHAKTAGQYRLLYFFSLLLTIILLFVASGLASFFLWPLQTIEDGIANILARKFSFRINLGRDDELGDVAEAFDQMAQGLYERHELSQFVSGALSKNLDGKDESLLQQKPEKCWGVVLASDIRNFTTLSESFPPEEVVKMLNRHLEIMSREIISNHGEIDKFIGDAIVAAFFAKNREEACKNAVNAAMKMMEQHRSFNHERIASGLFGYGMGVGLACGELLIGSFGAGDRHEYCLTGLPRKLSEELEAESKKGRFTHVVICPEIKNLLPEIKAVKLADSVNFEVVES